MSHFLRKLGRNRGSEEAVAYSADHNDEEDISDSALVSSYDANDPHHSHRAASEPTEQLLRSIPLHLRSSQQSSSVTRNVSNADSRFPGAVDDQLSPPNESDDPAAFADFLGLNVLYSPRDPDLDFILIHGLGGSPLKTWSYGRNTKNFWPLWLSQEAELSNARILSFGYNANFRGGSTSWNITDFAKDLLNRMLGFTEQMDDGSVARMGQKPILFIVHSMGGLVAKKAYIWGKHDERYSSFMPQIRGIVFLATPHRGSGYAKILNSILDTSPFGTSKKEYVAQLETESSAIQDINDQFRTVCADLILMSFYETKKTAFARGIRKIIVEKSSAVLDYPQEHSSPLNADHHTICKFESVQDDNYTVVKNMLKLVASRLTAKKRHPERRPSSVETVKRLETILGISGASDQDLNTYKARILEGSCQWIIRKRSFRNWIDGSDMDPHIYWLTGPPATGKSVLASFIVDWINFGFLDTSCQYHFFLTNHQHKRTVAYFLRFIAFQLAQNHEVIQQAIFTLNDETNLTFEQQTLNTIWDKLFEGIIFRIPIQENLYWIVDALDEADAAVNLCNLLLKVRSVNRIKLFVTSRRTQDLTKVLNGQRERIIHESLTSADTSQDIQAYVTGTIRENLPQDEDIQDELIEQIMAKANGSFLWVKLTLDSIRDSWHTQDDIRKALQKVPEGMESLYSGMLGIVLHQNDRNREIAQDILIWTICSYRPLSLEELQAALAPKFDGFVSLEDTIAQICGNFIYVSNGQVTLVHATARHFLFTKSNGLINKQESHRHLAIACLRYLSDDRWRHTFSLGPKAYPSSLEVRLSHFTEEHAFLAYAVQYWAYHVHSADCNSDELWELLEGFFQTYVLSWIHGVTISGDLRTLARTAQYLRGFVHRKTRQRLENNEPPMSLAIQDFQWLRFWANDLIRILGKFGRILLQEPKTIYRLIPILCPPQTQIGMTYGRTTNIGMSLDGLSDSGWDDCLAHVAASEDESISRVLATETHFLTLQRIGGKMAMWSAETCEELRRFRHGEYVTHLTTNKLGTLLVTVGIRTIRTWELSSGQEIHCFPRNSEAKTMSVAFGDMDTSLIVGLEDYSLQCHELPSGNVISRFVARSVHNKPQNNPRFMELSPDLSKVAVAERGKPVLVWDRGRPQEQEPWRCVGNADITRHLDSQAAWNPPEVVRWHPDGASLFILYLDSNLVHWDFIEDTQNEYSHTDGREMIISRDGNFLLTSDSHGTLSVWALPRLNIIYKLFHEDLVRDLAFSPDGQRIYDCRGPLCHVWEPDILIRHEDVERDDTSSNHESGYESSILSDPVVSQSNSSRSQVTALVCDLVGRYYCCGRDDGSVAIHDAIHGERLRKVYGHSSSVSVIALAWSRSGKYIVSADDAGRVICKRLEAKEAGKWNVYPVLDLRLKNPVFQFIFHPTENLLLMSTESTDFLWNIRGKMKNEIQHQIWPHNTGRRWLTHPLDQNKLLWVDPFATSVFDWGSLQPMSPVSPSSGQGASRTGRPTLQTTHSGSIDTVRCVSSTRNGRDVVIEIVPHTGYTRVLAPRNLRLQSMKLSSSSTSVSSRAALPELTYPPTRILGYFQDRLLFIDSRFWICSCEVADGALRASKRHFFLPRDWVSPASLQLVVVNEQGTLFCPKNGEVAIVRNGIRL